MQYTLNRLDDFAGIDRSADKRNGPIAPFMTECSTHTFPYEVLSTWTLEESQSSDKKQHQHVASGGVVRNTRQERGVKNHRKIRIHAEIGHDTDWVRENYIYKGEGVEGIMGQWIWC